MDAYERLLLPDVWRVHPASRHLLADHVRHCQEQGMPIIIEIDEDVPEGVIGLRWRPYTPHTPAPLEREPI